VCWGLVITITFTLMAPLKEAVADVRREAREAAKDTATEVREMRKAMESKQERQDAVIQAIKDVVVEGTPRPVAQQKLRKAEAK
jgi:glutamine synthetase adenylyltransferase